jgi:hypothetical protein
MKYMNIDFTQSLNQHIYFLKNISLFFGLIRDDVKRDDVAYVFRVLE